MYSEDNVKIASKGGQRKSNHKEIFPLPSLFVLLVKSRWVHCWWKSTRLRLQLIVLPLEGSIFITVTSGVAAGHGQAPVERAQAILLQTRALLSVLMGVNLHFTVQCWHVACFCRTGTMAIYQRKCFMMTASYIDAIASYHKDGWVQLVYLRKTPFLIHL